MLQARAGRPLSLRMCDTGSKNDQVLHPELSTVIGRIDSNFHVHMYCGRHRQNVCTGSNNRGHFETTQAPISPTFASLLALSKLFSMRTYSFLLIFAVECFFDSIPFHIPRVAPSYCIFSIICVSCVVDVINSDHGCIA